MGSRNCLARGPTAALILFAVLISNASVGGIRDDRLVPSLVPSDEIDAALAGGSRGKAHAAATSTPFLMPTEGSYSTYLGSSGFDWSTGVVIDDSGGVVLLGTTASATFPVTSGAFDIEMAGPSDTFVARFGQDRSRLGFSTFVGGTGSEVGMAIARDVDGAFYVVGHTESADFPVTQNGSDTSYGGEGDAFLAKLDPTGSLMHYATYFGGSAFDWAEAVLIHQDRVIVAGSTKSADFPTSPGANDSTLDGPSDAFVVALDRNSGAIEFATLFGRSGGENAAGLAIVAGGNLAVVGNTQSVDLPASASAPWKALRGESDGYVATFDASGANMEFLTYLGGSGAEEARDAETAPGGELFVTGSTTSADLETTPGAFDREFGGEQDAYVARLDIATGAVRFLTFLGGAGSDWGTELAVNGSGGLSIVGTTLSVDFPATPGAHDVQLGGGSDGYVAELTEDGSTLRFATFLGGTGVEGGSGIAVGVGGRFHVVGSTDSEDFPTSSDAFDKSFSGPPAGADAILIELDRENAPRTLTLLTAPPGLEIEIDAAHLVAPYSHTCAGFDSVRVSAPTPQERGETRYVLTNWSNGARGAFRADCGRDGTFVAYFSSEFRLSIESEPPGAEVEYDGEPRIAPFTVWCAAGSTHEISVNSTQVFSNRSLRFTGWSSGEPAGHQFDCEGPGTKRAVFEAEHAQAVTPFPLWPGVALAIAICVAVILGIVMLARRRRGRRARGSRIKTR